MRTSLRTLVTDLEIRAMLAAAQLRAAADLGGRSADAAAQMEHTAAEARRLLGEDLEGRADALYPTYQQLTKALHVRETLELPFLVLHDEAAARATALCAALLADINWPYEPIVVSTFSTGYYWTIAALRVIALPCGEERRLLGIPDLCHEVGHSAYARADAILVGDFMPRLSDHLRAAIDPKAAPGSVRSRERLTDAFQIWQEAWLQEFVCDLIATYLVGPAYLRQHLRLRAMLQPSSSFFALDLAATHPADDARMRGALALLRRNGFDTDAAELAAAWAEMIAAAGEAPPAGYDIAYADHLLEALAERVIDGCRQIGLRTFDSGLDPADDLPKLADEAWRQLLSDPETYGDWEREALAERWQRWGV